MTVVGLIGLGTLLDWLARSRRFTRHQSLLRLCYKEPLDLVVCGYVPPSDRRTDEAPAVANYETILATLGTLKTAAVLSQAVTATHNRKEVVIHVSEESTPVLEKDLILVGGTLANEVSRRFFEYVNANCPGTNVTLAEDVEEHNVMSAGTCTVEYDWTTIARDKRPSHDFGLVVFWVNPFTARRRRAILCAGFTSYGAYGARGT